MGFTLLRVPDGQTGAGLPSAVVLRVPCARSKREHEILIQTNTLQRLVRGCCGLATPNLALPQSGLGGKQWHPGGTPLLPPALSAPRPALPATPAASSPL